MAVGLRGVTLGPEHYHDLNLNHPTGTAAGDLGVVLLASDEGWVTAGPSGWTEVYKSAENTHRITIYKKTLTADDVTAGKITISNDASNVPIYAAYYVLSDPGSVEYYDYAIGTDQKVTVTGFTPAATGDILLCMCESNSGYATFSTTNNNPSWTIDGTNGDYWMYAAGHATYTTGATGAIGADVGAAVSHALAVVAVASPAASGIPKHSDYYYQRRAA